MAELQNRSVDQLTEMRVFLRAIDRGTFTRAADDLGLTPSAVSKLIARLEDRLGVRLVNRTTRKLLLTAEGQTYFQSGRQLIQAVDGLEQEVAASASSPRGLLRINTPVSLGVHHLAPALIEFNRRYPDVRVNLSLTDRIADFYAEQIDVRLRLQEFAQARLRELVVVDNDGADSRGRAQRLTQIVDGRSILFHPDPRRTVVAIAVPRGCSAASAGDTQRDALLTER